MINNSNKQNSLKVLFLFLTFTFTIFFSGCTSLGHDARSEPQLQRKLDERPVVVAVTGSGELVLAIEKLLVSRGIKVRLSTASSVKGERNLPDVRYSITATSVDHDMCVPEGSRQMHFYVSVIDIFKDERVFSMSGDYGCKDTLVKRFEMWFFE